MTKAVKLQIATFILQECYWGNTNLSAENILENIHDKTFARRIFNAILQSSTFMMRDLAIFDEDMLKDFIIEKSQNIGNFNHDYLKQRLDNLINLYIDPSYSTRKRIWN